MTVFDRFFGSRKESDASNPEPSISPPGPSTPPVGGKRYRPGERIAEQYEVVKLLEGGMGLVYLCADHARDRLPVALKTFKPRFLPDRATRDRFLREGTIWVGLKHHPHIVSAYGVERLKGGLEIYLVLEWVAQAEGKEDASLRNWLLPNKPLPIEQSLLFALHIASGMRYATTKIPGLLHRDLKPENILVGRDGNARVTDFGLAGVTTSLKEQLQARGGKSRRVQGILGTPHYMAPELWKRGAVADIRADIYAYGCILYEMLTGYMAIDGETTDDLARAHRLGQISELPLHLPPEIRALVQGCLALDPVKRFANWDDVVTGVSMVYQRVIAKDPPIPAAQGANPSPDTRAEQIAAGWSYDAMGLSYHDIGNHDLAAGYFERVVWIAKTVQDLTLEGIGLSHLGRACYALGDFSGALDYHKRHLAIARQTDDQAGESDALGNLGKTHTALHDLKQAITCFERQLLLVKKLGDKEREGQALSNFGDAYRRSEDFPEALESYKQALTLFKTIEDRLNEGRTLSRLGQVYATFGKTETADRYYQQALTIAREIGDRTGEGLTLRNLGNLQYQLGDISQTIWFLISYLSIVQEIGDKAGEEKALFELANLYLQEDKTEQAIESYQSALNIADKIGDNLLKGSILCKLGQAYYNLGELGQSTGFYEEGLKLLQNAQNQTELAEVTYRLANVYRDNNDLAHAQERYEQAIAIVRRTGDEMMRAKISFDYAIALALNNRREEALHYAELAAYTFKLLGHSQPAKQAKDLAGQIQRKRRWF